MLILTKYKQAIIKVLFGLTNCLFFVWLKKIFSSKSKKILLYFIAIFGISLFLWQFHFKAVLSDVNPPYKNTAHPRKDAFPTSTLPLGFNADTSLETPLASETINIDRLGYKLTKLYYQNGVDYFRCVTTDLTKNDLQYYCDSSINKDDSLKSKDSQCSIAHIFCTEEQVFNFQAIKRESFYKRSPGEKIIRLVKEYKSGDTILTDYRISYLPPYDQFNLVPTASTGVLNVSSVGNPAVKIGSGLTPASYTNYNGKASNLPACKAGASLQDIGNTCMLKIKIDDANKIKINAKDFDFAATNDYCHTKTKEAPVLGENCRLPSCLSIAKEYYRRPGINCLADCNDVAEFNGIDDANLRLPGINCLPACETGAKSVDYSSKQGSNLLLPKDIGVTCFLKHQNYVMPVCNSTPLANFSDDSNSQGINDIKTTVIANPKVPRKDCMNAADLPLCAFFSDVDRAVVANKFGCLGMVTQNTAGTPPFVDNKYVLGVDTINLSLPSKYDEDPGTETILKNIPIIDYTPSNCNDAAVTIGCGKPYTYSKLAQAASSIASTVYPANVDMIPVQDASYNDVLNHDSVNENHASSLRVNPFNNTTRPTATPGSVFSVNTSGYKIIDTLAFYYNATNKPSCSLLTKQELKFIGTRNCDLNQIWSDTTGGKNSIPDLSSSASKNFCEGQYFCKVDTRCSMFSDEQLQEAKVFFHCLPAQYSKYEESKADIKCNILNDFEILALTKTTKSSSEVKIDELDNYINKACFRGNLAFLIHKRVDHNIPANDVTSNIPNYASIKSSLFDANVLTNTPSVEKICDYDNNNRIDYMFPTGKPGACDASVTAISSATGSCLSGKFACYHSSQFHCNFDSYKRACYLLQNYKFKNAGMFFNDQSTTRIRDINIASTVPDCSSISPDLKQNCVVRYGLNNLGTLNCFNDHANFDNTAISGVYDADKFAIINKCDANPLLSVIFVPNAKTSIVYDARTPLSYKPINDNNTDCYNCYCLPIDNDPAAKTRYIMGGGLAADFDSSVRSVCGAADSNCYICYKPNFYAGLVKKSTPSSPYYPIIENAITTLPSITPKGSQQELTSDMGYYQYEDPFYSWFFFPKPNTSGLDATQTVRDCGNNKKCYKAFTVDFPNSRGNIDVDKAGYLNNETDRQIYLDFFEYPPIYYYGNGRYGDDNEKEKYNLASSEEGLDAGILNRVGLHSMNQVASPSATALRGSSMMGANPYGTYTYTSLFDRAWLCGMNRDIAGLPDEDTFAYFAPVLVQSGRFGLKANNVKGDPRRFAFSDTKWNSSTKKLEYYVNICLRYESVYALGACGRRECRIDNPPGMMHCGEDQCRKFMVEQPEEDSIYSKCHLLAAMGDVDGKRQSHWFLDDLGVQYLDEDKKTKDENKFLKNVGLPSDYEKCAKLYRDGYKEGVLWNYNVHRVRAFYENGYVCAELDFYGIDINIYNANKDDMNKIDANSSSFELPGGGKICYGGRTSIGKGQEKHCSFGEGSFNTFADLDSGIGGLPGVPDTTVWRTVRKVKFISNVSNDPNIEFLGYSVPKVANQSTQYAYRKDTNVHNLFPAKMKAKDGLITMVYNHDARIRKIEESLGSSNEADIFASSKNDRDPPSETSPTNDAYGLLQRTRGKKNPYYGFNGYDDSNWLYNLFGYDNVDNTIYNWLSTSYPDSHSLCKIWGLFPIVLGERTCPPDIELDFSIYLSLTESTEVREGGSGIMKPRPPTTEELYRKNFQPNNFLQEKVWLKSDCVPVQKRVGFPLSSAVATPDNAPNLFAPEPMVFALKTTNPNNPWKKATEIHDVDKLDFSDPEIVLKYGEKYYYLQVPQKHASLTKCHSAPFNDDSNQRLKFTLKEMPNDRFRDDSDLIDKLNHNIFNSSKNEVSTTPSSTFESDTAFFKEHHNLNLSKSDCSGSDKPYGVVITSNLRQIIGGPSISQLHAQIFVKKEQKDSDPVLCVYRATMDNDKPAMTTDDKLTVIGCFSRKHPVVNNMKLSQAVSSDTSKNDFLNHEVTFEYKYSDVASYTVIAKMFKQLSDSTVTTTAHKYKLATNRDALKDALEDVIYFEGIQISSARHRCTALNLDCIDNEREIQKICDTEKLICNRSIVQTKDDFKGLNESINNNNFGIFVTQPLALDLYKKLEFREYCIQGLLNDCNILNGYTDSDIAKFPEIKTLHPKWNNRSWLPTATAHLSSSAKDALGFNNMVCLKKGVINLIDQSPQFIVPKTIANDKGSRSSDPKNYEVCPTGKSCRVAEIYEYKQGSPLNNVITGNNRLCVGIGGGIIDAPKLVDFCEVKSYPLKNLKYKNFNINYANKINLIQQGNIRYQSLISKNPLTYSGATDSGENGVDKSHENRRGGVIITDNAKTANAELDVSFDGDTGMYGVCNGFWKNTNIDDAPRYSCTSTASPPLQLLRSAGSYSDTCQRYSCPAIQYGNKISDSYENQALQNGLYNQNGQVIGLDIAEKRGWASWQNFIKTNDNDFIENVSNTSQCLVGFAKNNITLDSSQCFDAISCASANTGNADASKMLTAICPTSSGSVDCSDPRNNVYNNYCPTGATCLVPSTHCNQFGYWRFTWSEEFRKAYDKDGLTAGATVLNECQRIKCSITNLEDKFQEGSINKTPIRLIKPRCDGLNTMVAELNTRIVNLQDNKYYYLKTNNLGACANANTLRIVKTIYDSSVPDTYDSIGISGVTDTQKPLNSHSDHNKVTAWYFKITSTTPPSTALEIIPTNLHITTNSNKNTIDHEKILKVWSKIAGFQPDADTRTLIPAMRNKTIEHAKIGGEKQSTNNDDDDYDTTGKCLASLGYRKITPEINPQLLCNYQGVLKIKEPCISTCDAVDVSMADTEIHGYSLWAETENKIKVCGDRCSPVTTKIPFSYIGKSTPQCWTGKKPYPYPPFRSLEGVKFKFMNNLIASVQARYHSSSTKSKDIYDATACSSALNGCIVEFDKTNITENVFLKESNTEVALYKKDSLGGKEKFASYDILPNVKYKINQESSDYFVTLVQSIKLTDDNRWQEYNINKRKIFKVAEKIFKVADCSISANSINCQCGSGSHPACPFDNVFDKISEGEVVEIKLASSSSPVSLKFQQNTSYTNNIDIETISTASSHFVLQLKKDLSGNLQWKQLVGSYLGLERLEDATSVSMATCTQLSDSAVGLPSSDYNCNLNLNINSLDGSSVVLRNNQEIKINFPSTVPTGGNPSDNYIVNYNSKPVKKYTSQGNLITDFNHQELFDDYILRAIDEPSNGVGIDYYLLINATDFASTSSNNNYPLPNRTCRYGIGNVWSLPDSACQNTCPGLTQVVPSDGNVERIISKNNFDDRIGVAITEHKIDATGLSLNTGEYLPVDGVAGVLNRDRIAVKVVEKIRNEATLHVIWPALSHQHDVTLILQKDANTYKIIQGNPDAANLPSGNADANNANKPFSAQHYETTSTKDSIILYRRCGASGKWQDPISLCPIAGPAKGGHSSLNSILGFVSASNIEPGSESTTSIEEVRAQTYFDFSIPGYDQGLLRQSSLFNMSDADSDFYRLVENAGLTNDITEIPVIPDYRIIGDSLNQFGVSNNGVPLGMNPHNIYAYAMCNYNYSNHSSNPVYYNFYNQDFGESSNNGWGTNAKYRCQPGTNNYLNTYKIALYEPTSPGVTPRTTACTQQCNTGIIHRVGRMDQYGIDDIFKNSSDSNKDYSTIPANLTKTYFAPDYYQKYAKYYQTPPSGFSLPAGQSDVYQFHQGRCLVGSDPNNCLAPNDNRGFAIFSNYTNNNLITHGSQNAIFNLISVSGSSDSSNSALINGSYQCKREASSSNYGVTASNGLTLKQRDHDNEPTRANKYCWGLPKTAMIYGMPKATCAPSGKWNLANPFHGKKEKSADIFRYSTVVYHNSNVGQHKINGGIIKEMFFQYGHLRYGNSETLCGTSDTSPLESFCDSTAFLIKENGKYDNSRRFSELGFGKVNDSNICECYNWFFGQHYVSIGDRVSIYGQNMVTVHYLGNLFDELCKTGNANYNQDKKCLGINIDRVLDLDNSVDSRDRFIIRSSGVSAGHSNDPAHSRDKDFRIIMWGCPDDLESYDYGKNECKPSSGSTAIYGFNSEVAYGNSPPSCSAFNLATGMLDPINPSVTSVTLYENTDKKMACADGYDVSLNIGATSPKLTCPTPLPSPPRVTANFSCQEKQCTSQVVAAFCNQESITGTGCQNQLNGGSTFVGNCSSPGNNAGGLANTIICNKGVVGYNTYDSSKLCGSFCSYTLPTATKDGFVFQATPTEIPISYDLIVRTGTPMSFQCKTGFSLKPDATASQNINCVANSISYSDARCISNNYCSLNSAPDINFASTNCNQPGIFCKKVNGATTEILISQNQSVNVSCGGSTVGTKTYNCISGSSTGGTATTSDTCSPITCTVPSAFSTANILYGSSPLTSSTALGYRDSSGGLTCATGYTNSADLGYTCTTSDVAKMTGRCYRQCRVNIGVITGNAAYKNSSSSEIYLDHGSISNANIVCSSGYSGTAGYACNDGTLNLSGCNVKSCSMPSDSNINISANQLSSTESPIGHDTTLYCIQGYTSVYSAGSASLMADCTGASGAVAEGAVAGGSCVINKCDTLPNSDYSAKIGVYKNEAICNGDLGFGSSTGSNPVCRTDGTWSASCRWNSCNVNQIAGYNTLPTAVANINSSTGLYYFSPPTNCATGYSSIYGSAVYNCWNTDPLGVNITIDPEGCLKECPHLANSDYSAKIGVHKNEAICNGNLGFGSSTGSNPVCLENGTWSALCRRNQCSVNTGVPGYNYERIQLNVPYGGNYEGSEAGLGYYLFSGSQHCLHGYTGYGDDNQAGYNCNNQSSDGITVAINPQGCNKN